MKFSKIKVGLVQWVTTEITTEDMNIFAELTCDSNSIHQGEDGVVYGMLTASFISTLIGNFLPGDGAVWKSQTLKFALPVYTGDALTIKGEVIGKDRDRKEITILTDIYNQNNEVVLFGTAVIKCTK